MNLARTSALLFVVLLASACGGSNVCDEPKEYQASRPGKRIEAPEGLDSLNSSRELSIPEASPREPRPEGSPCLELPPTFGSDDNQESNPAG